MFELPNGPQVGGKGQVCEHNNFGIMVSVFLSQRTHSGEQYFVWLENVMIKTFISDLAETTM